MHAFLIVGKNQKAQKDKAAEILQSLKAKEVITLEPTNKVHTIQSIRELSHTLSLHSPHIRGVIILEADKLSQESGNALLKTLEEPTQNTLLVLTAPDKDTVLETIVSRCFIENLGPREIEITGQDQEKAREIFQNLVRAKMGERFKFVDTIHDREEALKFVVGQIFAAREVMLSNESQVTSHKLLCLLDTLIQTKSDLEANVNTKLALTNLMLHYPNVQT